MASLRSDKFRSRYSLQLANGQGWHIIAAEEVGTWIEKFASIMGLKACELNGYPKLVFLRSQSGKKGGRKPIFKFKQNILESFPRSGWKLHDLRVMRLWFQCDVPDIICEVRGGKNHELDIIRMWYALNSIYQRAQESGGVPFHAALIERDGMGILLAGRGGKGKSTCCQRLSHPWHVLCDDETLIVLDDQKRYFAHPFPTWSDYLWKRSERTWNVQQYLPLSAIFFIEQAETNEAIPLGQGESATLITQSAIQVCQRSWRNLKREEERAPKKKLFDNACELSKTIPAYILRVSLKGRFWDEIEKVLPKGI